MDEVKFPIRLTYMATFYISGGIITSGLYDTLNFPLRLANFTVGQPFIV
jgi:hypothetical protein